MLIQTTRFGEIDIDEREIITMPNGLLGFSNDRLYVMLDDEVGSPFKWLQSVEKPKLAFVTIDPTIAVSNYSLSISEEHMKKMETTNLEELSVLVIVTMTRDLKDVTINLQGPLIINQVNRVGIQMVIPDSPYSTRYPLFGDKLQFSADETRTQRNTEQRKAAAG
ncbi:MAG: flagellar assembly protein FliW [SAR324 cluster bacterium]|nr:flagellar assembly protein FliW [SAR324 cluster bacterium]